MLMINIFGSQGLNCWSMTWANYCGQGRILLNHPHLPETNMGQNSPKIGRRHAFVFGAITPTVYDVSSRKWPRVWGTSDFGKKPWRMCLGRWERWRWWRLGVGSIPFGTQLWLEGTLQIEVWNLPAGAALFTDGNPEKELFMSCRVAELLQLGDFARLCMCVLCTHTEMLHMCFFLSLFRSVPLNWQADVS